MGAVAECQTKEDINKPFKVLKLWLENQDRRDIVEVYLNENGELKAQVEDIIGSSDKLASIFEELP